MDEEKLKKILIETKLLKKVVDNIPIFRNILERCLKVGDEQILIIADKGRPGFNIPSAICYGYLMATGGKNTRFVFQRPKKRGDKASKKIVQALKDLPKKSIIIMALSNRLGNISRLTKSFRKYAQEQGHKYISTTSLGSIPNKKLMDYFKSLDIDYPKMKARCERLKLILDKAKTINITTKKGTDLTFDVENVKAICNEGDYSDPLKGGNIPAGEVYMPTLGTTNVDGTVVIDISAAARKGTIKIKKPIILEIKKGSVVDIKGKEEAKELAKTLLWAESRAKHPEYISKVSELGFGLNKNIKPIGSTIMDEKSFGTAHIALGSNYWFGGNIFGILHLDLVFENPQIKIDGKSIKYQ